MSEHITTDLVEDVARHGFAEAMADLDGTPSALTFDEMEKADQFRAKEAALTMLQLVTPVLLQRGWIPPIQSA